ncbi:envelope stress response membrane protein PspB [Novosphingobium sp. SG707]|uniref:envelope stress response membrane protein PspB n=1 Tax=Novosphingobium sp. SG707 TaxID=2586996 RepID=UPI001447BDC7|nr:envelope stress response membrane protein PspB [Novosphingobium sp. SG707]NKI99247.1 phage shock protein B [Novosphingobium sp. SG707]
MDIVPLVAICALFIGLPWIILHYVTKWKTSATLTSDDEALLEELYQLARRLDERMETVERLVASDHPDFRPAAQMPNREIDNQPLREIAKDIDRLRARSSDRSFR